MSYVKSYLQIAQLPFPELCVNVAKARVTSISWGSKIQRTVRCDIQAVTTEDKHLLQSCREDLKRYFRGEAVLFDWPLDWNQGTSFQRKVWQALRQIPYGQTRSYSWLAEYIGQPLAVRAVGNANGKNPFSLIVPCHRIIQKNGRLGGYSGGVPIKQQLLDLEKND